MRKLVHVVSLIILVISGFWLYNVRDYEPLLALIGALLAFITSFDRPIPAMPSAPTIMSNTSPLSDEAMILLSEIDRCDESDPKGVSLMMHGGTVAMFRPFIWENHVHGPISGDYEQYDPSGKLSAIDELADSGYLIPHYESGSLQQWRRTNKRRP